MVAIPFPINSSPGVRIQDGGGRLINARVEKVEGEGRGKVRWIRTAGLGTLTTVPVRVHCRGFIFVNSELFMALDDRIVKITLAGGVYTVTDLGSLLGTLPVTFARNNKVPTPDIVAVTENGAFNILSGGAPTAFADADLPIPNSVSFSDGYFFFTLGDARVFASGLNDVTIDALTFAKAESRPGGLIRGWVFAQNLFLAGQDNIEVWQNTANAPPGFPFSRSTVIRIGLAGPFSVAGFEDEYGGDPMWVGSDGRVYKLTGLSAEAISTVDVERSIAGAADKTLLRAQVYMENGHPIWSLTGTNFTWEYDSSTQSWIERTSYLDNRWRAERTIKAFGMWVAGDRATGKLFEIAPTAFREDANPMIWEVLSGQAANYPGRFVVGRTDFDFVTGVGNAAGAVPIETDPHVEVTWSDDGGYYWHIPRLLHLGAQARTGRVPPLFLTGMTGAQGRMYKLRVSDPVPAIFMGGNMAIEGRSE